MTAAPIYPGHEWTAEEFDALPESSQRHELIDGVLHVSPSATKLHQWIANRLGSLLDQSSPDDCDVTQGVEIRLADRVRYIPDLLVLRSEAFGDGGAAQCLPGEVRLAVEIVSNSSRGLDRILKPAQYAAAGIGCYWRIETVPAVAVHAFELTNGGYRPVGTFTDRLIVDAPWPMNLDLSRLRRNRGA